MPRSSNDLISVVTADELFPGSRHDSFSCDRETVYYKM